MSFGEDVGSLIRRSNWIKMNGAMKNMMTYEVTVNLDMLGAFMKYIIVSNLDSTLIVTTNSSGRGMRHSY